MNLFRLFRTLVCYLWIAFGFLIFVPPCFFIACLPAKYRYGNRVFFRLLHWYYGWIVYGSLNPVRFKGTEHLPDGPAIFTANHQSAFDIPVVGYLCRGFPHVWLVLAYYVDAPILGFFITRMFVPVDPRYADKAAGALRKVIRYSKTHDSHLIIFPEGARHNDGKVHDFFKGFAIAAQRTRRPVIPIYMPTTGSIYPINSFYIYSYPLDVIIGKPFFFQDDESETEFTQRVYDWFVKEQIKYSS